MISNIYKNYPYQLIAPIVPVQVLQGPRPRREFNELYMPISQVFDKLKAKGLLKPLNPNQFQTSCPQSLMRIRDALTTKALAMILTVVLALVMQFRT